MATQTSLVAKQVRLQQWAEAFVFSLDAPKSFRLRQYVMTSTL